MKSKGFTLIELLAVIVILAIIALIATPTILGVVDTARKGAAQSSILGYIDAVEKQAMINEMDESTTNDITDGTYTISDLTGKGVTVKGDVPTAVFHTVTGSDEPVAGVVISGGEVQNAVFVTRDKRYDVTYTKDDGKASADSHNDTKYPTTTTTESSGE